MAAATDVQFFSDLNTGLPQLTNAWGCMINLLDACLVNGVSLPTVSSLTVATGGNITVNFSSAHGTLLFQCVTLSGFSPIALNGKYRVIGVPSTTQLTLSSDLSEQSATTIGTAKISPLGYEIIFSATTKRVYRALNPTANHPFIRVDESLTSADGTTGVYTSTYEKYAMVGLLASMSNIDDVNNSAVLQLPFDTTTPAKNWTISGTGTACVRGWSKWYWATNRRSNSGTANTAAPSAGSRQFTLAGNKDAFFLNVQQNLTTSPTTKHLYGCGLFGSALDSSIVPNWFLMTSLNSVAASAAYAGIDIPGNQALGLNNTCGQFYVPTYLTNGISSHNLAYGVMPDYLSGYNGLYSSNNVAALQIPIVDNSKYLRGTLPHVHFAGNKRGELTTTIILADTSMYLWDSSDYQISYSQNGGFFFYLGEMS